MDLLDKKRQLVYSGKLLCKRDGIFGRSRWSELFVLLFDNYCEILSYAFFPLYGLPSIFSGDDKTKGN